MWQFITDELAALKKKDYYRYLRVLESPPAPRVTIDGRHYLSFCSNNYLGLANHPYLKEAAIAAIEKYGTGSSASRLIAGTNLLHMQLEEKIARFKGCEAAIIFPSGYMANVGTITALVGKGDVVIIDRYNHASIIDGCRQSNARLLVYKHCCPASLEKCLRRAVSARRRLVVTDSIFSMDGDIAPLPEIIACARSYQALVMIDEAHATGVLGATGRGALEHFGLEESAEVIIMGTLSKALGSLGGFIAGSADLIDYLRHKARSFVYTTAPPPSLCAAALAALELIEREPQRLTQLWQNVTYLRKHLPELGFALPASPTPIIPLPIGEAKQAVAAADYLYQQGIFLLAIRPPSVLKGTSRLRLTLMSDHTTADLERLVATLAALKLYGARYS